MRARAIFSAPSALILLALSVAAAAACAGEADEGPLNRDIEDTGTGVVETLEQPEVDFDVKEPNSCPMGVLCGDPATCCESGKECVDGACAAACTSGTRCGTACCSSGEVCLAETCTKPGADCNDSFDCPLGQFCEPTLGKCLPQPKGSTCEYRPAVMPFKPAVEWSWTASATKPDFDQVINMPVVIDLDKSSDNPEVIIVTSSKLGNFEPTEPAYLRALDGKTGKERWPATADVYKDAYRVSARGTPAAADLHRDGTVEIIAPAFGGGLLAFDGDGKFLWRARRADGTAYTGVFSSVTIALADLDGDGQGEIIAGGVVLDNTGKIISGEGREFAGANDLTKRYGAVSIVADVDNDGKQDVVTGTAAYRKDGTAVWTQPSLSDGYTAIADFELDGKPELVVIAQGNLRIQDARTGALIASLALPGTGRGGPPTIADFDGDGVNEIASANGNRYNVFEYDAAATPKLAVKWSKVTQDASSNVTGSSVFDFEGDGSSEVVYGDECFFRVYGGKDGTVLFETPSSSATLHEFPVVADVDGDNNTEIIVVSNDSLHIKTGSPVCPTTAPLRHGVFVYGDANDKWVRTRKMWNQHAYHITNANTSGMLPKPEPKSWVPPVGYNNYRVSQQGAGLFNAPDLKVDLEVSTVDCPTAVTLRARVKNVGTLGVAKGVKVAFYEGTSAMGTPIATTETTKALLPGESEVVTVPFPMTGKTMAVSFFVTVDGASATASTVDECNEDNNTGNATGVRCALVK